MADEKKNSENSPEGSGGTNAGASPVGAENIDELLATAAQSLSDIDDNLGDASDNKDSSKPPVNSKKEKSILQGEDEGSKQIDDTLAELEKELNNVVKEVEQVQAGSSGSSPAPQADAKSQQTGPAVSQTTPPASGSDNASSPEEEQVDEFLASVDKAEKESNAKADAEDAGHRESSAVSAKPEGEAQKVKEIEDIINTLPDIESDEVKETGSAAVEGAAAAVPAAEKTAQMVEKKDTAAGQPKEDHTSSSPPAEEVAKAPSEEKPPTPELKKPPEKEAHIPEEEARKAEKENPKAEKETQKAEKGTQKAEKQASPQGQAKSSQVPDQSSANQTSAQSQKKSTESVQENYEHFNRPQQLLIRTLNKTDQVFSFVPDEAKDTIGMIAIVTLIITILAAAALLIVM